MMNVLSLRSLSFLLLIASLCLVNPTFAKDADLGDESSPLAIPYSKFVLDNGLTLVVHEDRKAPIAAVNVWYHVGSKDEKEGRTGFAHLFEHLMFNGSENYDYDWFKAFDRVGATGLNGTTNQDRTNYFQVVPKNALEMTLWMESDRMGHLLGAVTQEKLDEQREVVKNEKRQGENQPYGRVFGTILENVFPKGHPYSWSVIGSMEDLNAASLDDVKEWFKQKYGAANATIVVAGDVDPQETLALVEKYFGHIDAGPPLTKQSAWIAKRSGKHIQTMYDRVPQARVYKIWNVPQLGSAEADYLDLASRVLSSDKRSRLYNRLVYNERKASDISAFSFNSEIAGLFGVIATALDPADIDYIEQAIDEELAAFFKEGPTKAELERVKNGLRADFVRGLEKVGGFGGKSDILARNQVYSKDPNAYLESISRIEAANAKTVRDTAKHWLSDGEYVLRVMPFAKYSSTTSTVDRSTGLPEVGAAPTVEFDRLERATLDNGLKIILAQRDAIPTVNMRLMFNAGYSTDYLQKPGVASLTMAMLDEGTKTRDALEISTELAELGTYIGSSASINTSAISLDTLTSNLDASVALFAEIAQQPSFPQNELDRLIQQRIAAISQEKSSPFGMGYRALPKLIYGTDHPYSNPFSGSGNELSVASMTVDDLRQYHENWFKAENGTLIVTGDISMEQLVPLAEKYFNDLPSGTVPERTIDSVSSREAPVIYLIDRPNSQQSAIIATKMMPAYGFENELPMQLMNEVFGGSFNARLNMNLREDKGWSYGARSSIPNIKGQRPFLITTQVQSDKTAASLNEIQKELSQINSSKTIDRAELARALDKYTLTLPGRWETAAAVEGDIATLVNFDLDESYWDNYVTNLRSQTLESVQDSAAELINTDQMLWLVVGDLSLIQDEIESLGFGEVIVVDVEGTKL
ncbi:MAG: pitrilysin family protein [Pseudomonadota bacterium]